MIKLFHMNIELQKMKTLIISVTKNGDATSTLLKEKLEILNYKVDICLKEKLKKSGLQNTCKEAMGKYNNIIFISSTGIAVRGIAPFIKSKDIDPAVVVVDNSCKYAISLLSGHLGGANNLTEKVANILKCEAVITTATDNLNIIAPDVFAMENNLVIDSLKKCKDIAASLVEGKKVGFYDDKNFLHAPKGYYDNLNEVSAMVYVTNKMRINENIKTLKLIRKDIVLGIGCRKDYDVKNMEENVLKELEKLNIDIRSIKEISTVEIKANEKAILSLKERLSCKLNIFSIEDVKKIENKYETSEFVRKTIGVGAVSAPVVELSNARVLIEKLKLEGMTLSIGEKLEEK
ncbi:cobalt-precorrin 5A hydrolase [Clostridium senegalense]|nr:cobalt-precorrin 5A hydrolase [Clostridium senegalense]